MCLSAAEAINLSLVDLQGLWSDTEHIVGAFPP